MAELEELLSVVQESDLDVFGGLFGTFELYMPEISDEESTDPGLDIQQPLNLPSAEPEPPAETPSLDIKEPAVIKEEIKTENDQSNEPRFKKLTMQELDQMKENKYAQKTKSNSKWAINLFQGEHGENLPKKANSFLK